MNDLEGTNLYYTQMNILLRHWHNHQISEHFLETSFTIRVWLETLRIYLKEHNHHRITTSFSLAKTSEEARVNND